MSEDKMKFLVASEYGELLDLVVQLKNEGYEAILHTPDHNYKAIGTGMVEKTDDSWIHMGQGYIWVFDGCARGKRQDWLRSKGELVVGGSEKGDKLENERQLGNDWFKAAGFAQVESKNFKSIDEALHFVKQHKNTRYIMKQNGDAPKSINHMGKFDGNEDMLFHLEELKTKWNEAEYGQFDCDLMEVVEGLEVAASVFFNGSEYLKNKEGKVVGFLNFEEKKEVDGQLGETTGEMGTLFMGVTEDNPLFKDIVMRPKIVEVLKKIGFRGVFDINCIKTKDGIVALEPTMRFGVPATSYEFIEGMNTPTGELLSILAKGEDKPIDIHMGWGMVMVIAAKPYPVETDLEDTATSLGEKLWVLKAGKPVKDFDAEQQKHIHLQNFHKKDGYYCVATKSGYLLTVTGKGETIESTREELIQYIKDNLYISGMKYRTDIGQRVEEATGVGSGRKALEKRFTEKEKQLEQKKQAEVQTIKDKLKAELYG